MEIVGEAGNGREAVQLAEELRPDVIVMDVAMPELNGIEATRRLASSLPHTRVVALSMHKDSVYVREILRAGARGYLLKNMPPSELLDVIRQVHDGKKRIPPEVASTLLEHMSDEGLTEREVEVLREVAGGNRNREIAERLFISEETVKVHIKHIMEKLGANDRTQAVAIGVRRGIIHL
jgi:DNA-binding NarL/FixJ family response regulator